MQRIILLLLFVSLSVSGMAQNAIEFVQNKGQWPGDFAYKATTPSGDLYLQKGGYTINLSAQQNHDKIHDYTHGEISTPPTLNYHAYRVEFVDANMKHTFKESKPQKHYYNYFLGNDPDKWQSYIHPHLAIDYKNLYPGIDAHVYTDQQKLKYDIIVAPKANPSIVRMRYEGVDELKITNGNLLIGTSLGEMTELKPFAYQFINGERVEIPCDYKLDNNSVSFDFPKGYNPELKLTIDPVLVFSTFSGATGNNWGTTATYDQFGNYFGGGFNLSAGFPTSLGAYDTSFNGGSTTAGGGQPQDVTIIKLDATGANLRFGTYIGGTSNEQPHSLIVDTITGNLVIAGRTYSSNFPTSGNAVSTTNSGGADMFVFVIDSTGGNLVGSTYVGGNQDDGVNIDANYGLFPGLKHNYGNDARSEVILDNAGNIYVSAMTSSTNFPIAGNTVSATNSGGQDGVIFQLNQACSLMPWSTYVGGSGDDACYVLTFDKTSPNDLYVAGGTASSNFQSTNGVLHSTAQGGIDGFVMKFNATSKALVASTYIGTNAYDQVFGIQTDESNNVYIMGQTQGAYPTTAGVYSNPGSSQFITKLDANLTTILVSTVFGTGTTAFTDISPTAFLVDRCGNIYVSGWGGSLNVGNPGSTNGLPSTPATIVPPLRATTDGNDFYYFVVDNNMTNLVYAAFFGINTTGISGGEHVDGGTSRFDPNGVVYQAMCASCGVATGFPTTVGSYAPVKGSALGDCNLGAVKIDFQLQDPDADADAGGNARGCAPHTVNFVNNSSSATSYVWDFGDGSPTSSANSPSHTYTTAGIYYATLTAINPNGCTVSSDIDSIIITVLNDSIQPNFLVAKVDSCNPYSANFINTTTLNNGPPNPGTSYLWDFGDGTTFFGQTPPLHNFPAPQSYVVKLIVSDTNACNNPDSISIQVDFTTSNVLAGFQCPDSVCMPASITFTDMSTNVTTYSWTFGDGGTSAAANPTHDYTSPGTYTIKLVTENPTSCNLIDSFEKTITVLASPTVDFTYSPNPPTPNTALQFTNKSSGATSYQWDFGDGTTKTDVDPTHIYQQNGFYVVCLRGSNGSGCPDTACKTVQGNVIPLVDVPSGFSPNGDGVNDVARVLGYGIESLRFQIYNRWGELVFETNDLYKGWDGTYKGEPQEMEVYGYLLDVTFFDGSKKLKKGNITLLR